MQKRSHAALASALLRRRYTQKPSDPARDARYILEAAELLMSGCLPAEIPYQK